MVIPVAPPSIQGLSAFGGFQFEVLDLSGGDITQLAAVTQQVAARGQPVGPRGRAVLELSPPTTRSCVVTIDRDRARSLGLPIREVTDALAVLLGSQYVNDFDFNNRAYRVYVQGDQQFRAQPTDLSQYYARASNGDMVPLSAVVRTTRDDGAGSHQPLQPVPLDGADGRGAAGRQLGPGASGDGTDCARDAAAGLRLRVGGPVARRDQSRATRRCISSRSAFCSSISCWRRSTRAGCCRSSFCWACRWRCSAR